MQHSAPCASSADPDPLDGVEPQTAYVTIGDLDAEVEFVTDGRHSISVNGALIAGQLVPVDCFSASVQTALHRKATAVVAQAALEAA